MEYDILDDKTVNAGNLSLSSDGVKDLKTGRGWAMFVAIVGIIGTGFMVIAAFIMFAMGSAMNSQMGFPGAILGVVYLVLAGINLIPIIFCMKFASKAGIACDQNDNTAFNLAIRNLRTMFKSTGIIVIAVLSLYIVGIIVAFIFGMSSLF
jgi:hypothetical protein